MMTPDKDAQIETQFNHSVRICTPAKGSKVPVVVYSGRDIPDVDFILDDNRLEEEDVHPKTNKSKGDAPNRNRIHKNTKNDSDEEVDYFPEASSHVMDYFTGVAMNTKSVGHHIEFQEDLDESHVNYLQSEIALNSLRAKNVAKFEQIFLFLKEKFSVLLYGFGSKRKLLCSFADKFLKDEHYLMINGYCPGLSYQDVASKLADALEAESTSRESLVEAVRDLDQDFFLVIHSLDVLFGNSILRLKELICDLIIESDGCLHLIGSVDHLNSGLLFDSTARTKIDLVWMETKTFIPYTVERGYKSSVADSTNSAIITLNSVIHVYESLTPNAQKIFLQILEFCVDKKEKVMNEKQKELEFKAEQRKQRQEKQRKRRAKSRKRPIIEDEDEEHDSTNDDENDQNKKQDKRVEDEDLSLSTLYSICREEYLVNSEITLKAQLTEFQDHNIIKVAKATDGSAVIRLNVKLDLAQSFLTRMKERES